MSLLLEIRHNLLILALPTISSRKHEQTTPNPTQIANGILVLIQTPKATLKTPGRDRWCSGRSCLYHFYHVVRYYKQVVRVKDCRHLHLD